jgi:hypothetical protein
VGYVRGPAPKVPLYCLSAPPALAAGLPDHGWTRREVLRFRGPPWPQPAGLCAGGAQDERETTCGRGGCGQAQRAQQGPEAAF